MDYLQMYDIDGNPLQGTFLEQLNQSFGIGRVIACTDFSSGYTLSTVLLPYATVYNGDDFYLFETAIFKPNGDVEIMRRTKTVAEAYAYHCNVRSLILSEQTVTVTYEEVHDRFATPEKQDFTIHI